MSQESTFRVKAPWIMEKLLADFPIGIEDAAAIVGNLGHESGGFTLMQEQKPTVAGSRGGYGWAQWTGPRRREFEAYCARNNLDPSSDKANYAFLFLELKGSEKRAIPAVVGADGLDAKVVAFEQAFERAGVKHYASRQKWARLALELWADRPAAAPVPEAVPIPTPRPTPEPTMPTNTAPDGKELTPVEQMNKPVQGAKAGFAVTSVTGALLYLWSTTEAFPDAWQNDAQAVIALTLVASAFSGLVANFVASYLARDKRFTAPS